ncbi:hypothetical protein [Micromonospora sp. DT47]|uniref:hypothetical protein n=1 Tax=Micromonospora sp. DT47 TaxID=3393431 RepID=UPI003CE8BCA8
MKTRRPLLVAVFGAAAAMLLAVVGCAAAGFLLIGDDPAETRTCQESMQVAEAKVRTDHWDPPDDLPDLGDYPEIHWQLRTSGNPCSRMPGPNRLGVPGRGQAATGGRAGVGEAIRLRTVHICQPG